MHRPVVMSATVYPRVRENRGEAVRLQFSVAPFPFRPSSFVLTSSPGPQKECQIRSPHAAVAVQIGRAIFGVEARAPVAQQEGQIESVHAAVAIEIGGVAVTLGHTGRVGRIRPGLQKQLPVVAVCTSVKIHIGPGAAGPGTTGTEEAFLEKVQIVGIDFHIRIIIAAAIDSDGPVADVVPFYDILRERGLGTPAIDTGIAKEVDGL